MWGIIPAAGKGTRIQPLAFSKELLPVGGRRENGVDRPRAVSEYIVERMTLAGATQICFVVGPGKADIVEYYASGHVDAGVCYVVQPAPGGLCDAIFRALPVLPAEETVVVGLPDTIWFPEDALRRLPEGELSFLLFPVERPHVFDAVVTGARGEVVGIEVKRDDPSTNWVWGAFKLPVPVLRALHALWLERNRADEYIGTLVNEYLRRGGRASAVRAGEVYLDVGTLEGYREAIRILGETEGAAPHVPAPAHP